MRNPPLDRREAWEYSTSLLPRGRALWGQEAEHPGEEGCPNDRPEQRKGVVAHCEEKGLRQSHLPAQPKPQEGADEADHDGNQAPAVRVSREGLPETSNDARDEQKD